MALFRGSVTDGRKISLFLRLSLNGCIGINFAKGSLMLDVDTKQISLSKILKSLIKGAGIKINLLKIYLILLHFGGIRDT